MRRPSAYEERLNALFWAKVLRGLPDECWPWQGYAKPSGHGLTTLHSMPIHAHRKAWILTHGPIRDGQCANHTCDNALCCNPAHLYLGSRADNMIDLWERTDPSKRAPRGRHHVITNSGLEKLWAMYREGATRKQCAAAFDVHVSTVARYIQTWRKGALERMHADRVSTVSKSKV